MERIQNRRGVPVSPDVESSDKGHGYLREEAGRVGRRTRIGIAVLIAVLLIVSLFHFRSVTPPSGEMEDVGKKTDVSGIDKPVDRPVVLDPLSEVEKLPISAFSTANVSLAIHQLKEIAVNNIIVFAETNSAFLDMTRIFVRYLNRVGIDNILIVALDKRAFEELKKDNLNVILTDGHFPEEAQQFLNDDYNRIVRGKFMFVKELIYAGFDVLLLDVDVFCLKNPLELMSGLGCDLVGQTSSDNVRNKPGDRCFPGCDGACAVDSWLNTGCVFFSSNSRTRRLLDDLTPRFEAKGDMTVDDQFVVNAYLDGLKPKKWPQSSCTTGGCYEYDYFNWILLDPAKFPDGRAYFKKPRLEDWPDLYCVHFNWIATLGEKISKMKQLGFWDGPK